MNSTHIASHAESRQTPSEVRWNFTALMIDVTAFSLGMAFLDQTAVLPLLLKRLGASGPLIGGFAAVRYLAFSLFQIFVSYYTHGRRQKPWLALIAISTRLPLLILPWFIWHASAGAGYRNLALWTLILTLSIWALGDGLGYVPWMEIVARAFSEKIRGRFFAATQLTSGLISVGIAVFAVQVILHSKWLPFPHNYALLCIVSALMFQISSIGILLIREPAVSTTVTIQLPSLTTYIRRLPEMVRTNRVFRRLAAIQLLIGFGSAASSFYVLYAQQRFGLSDEWGARYQVMQALGVVVLMPAWALLSERFGSGASVRGVALACMITPILALSVGRLSPWLFSTVFLLMGGSLNWGIWITLNHFLLTHTKPEERSVFVALLNLISVPSALYPIIGGLLAPHDSLLTVHGIPILFVITATVTGTGLLMALRLKSAPGSSEEHDALD